MTDSVELGTRVFVSVIEAKDVRDVEADPLGLAVPELVSVIFTGVPVIVGLPFGVKECLSERVELDEALDVLDGNNVLV